MGESNWDGWNEAIRNMEMPKREPMWDQAIKYLSALWGRLYIIR